MLVRNRKLLILVGSALGLLLVACGTSRNVTAPPAPQTIAPAPATAPAAAPQVSSEEAAWQKLVQGARREGRLVVYDTLYFTGDTGRAVSKAFKEKYGITVEFLITGGSSATIERLKAEKSIGQAVADMAASGSVSSRGMIELGLMADVSQDLPSLRDRSQFAIDPVYSPGREAITFIMDRIGPGFNSNLVKPGEIQSHKDFLDPRWKGKIAMRDPRLGSGGEPLSITAFRYNKLLDDDYFTRLAAQNPTLLGMGYYEIAQMVARGEYAIYWQGGIESMYAPIMKQGGPLSVYAMKEGTVAMPSVLMALKNANHPNAARVFLNWMLSAEGQKVFHEARGSTPFRKDVADFAIPQIANVKFDKFVPITWEISGLVNTEVRSGVMEKFFGKR